MACKLKVDDRQSMVNGCNHEKKELIQCTAADYKLLKCKNVYNSDQADWGNVPSRCVGCKQQIVVDLDKKKASENLD
jgi:hypothetical protein